MFVSMMFDPLFAKVFVTKTFDGVVRFYTPHHPITPLT
jgi:hypothetical protein